MFSARCGTYVPQGASCGKASPVRTTRATSFPPRAVRRFLKDIEDGEYNSYADLGISELKNLKD
jgi:hypothetical protein